MSEAAGSRRLIVAVDPGTRKCGLAAITPEGRVERLEIVRREVLAEHIAQIARTDEIGALLVGDRTGSREMMQELSSAGLSVPPQTVPEHETTLRARARYFQDNPPRGWRRLIPRGMLLPPGPVDDYAALVMAEDWLREHGE